jgi:16S rRNA (guanine966-N2)-methyltransferase
MRVISGRFKGRRLASPTWAGLRPTSDKLKGQLFEILGAAVPGACVMDGYAGTGALGIEALSRGARHVVFVDADSRAMALVADNLRACGVEQGYAMMRGEVAGIVSRLPATLRFDVILLDPPYDDPAASTLVAAVVPALSDDGLVVLEHARRAGAPEDVAGLVLARRVRSGDSALAFYRRDPGPRAIEPAPGPRPDREQ